MKKRAKKMTVEIDVQCISCKKVKTLKGGECQREDPPMCEECYMPMIAKEVRSGKKTLHHVVGSQRKR